MTDALTRRRFFLYQDGFTLACVLSVLEQASVISRLQSDDSLARLSDEALAQHFLAKSGYFAVAMRCLRTAGIVPLSQYGSATTISRLIEIGNFWRNIGNQDLTQLANLPLHSASPLEQEWLTGALHLPALFHLQTNPEHLKNDANWPAWQTILQRAGFYDTDWTASVGPLRRLLPFAGILVSYLPMYQQLHDVMFRGKKLFSEGAVETHVDRKMNVIASGAAHERYFHDADRLFAEIFNATPIAAQPKFVCDMGCGDGSWLIHIYRLIGQTERGKQLAEFPIRMVGVDYNRASLETTRKHLTDEGVPCELLFGDIGDPDGLAEDLATHGLDIRDGLHIRSFIDHNRPFVAAPPGPAIPLTQLPSGSYVDRSGHTLSAHEVAQSLAAHFKRWARHIAKHGLVLLEAHCIAPTIALAHAGETSGLTFDTHHGFSHQYLVDYPVMQDILAAVGLRSIGGRVVYPSHREFVSISLERVVAA